MVQSTMHIENRMLSGMANMPNHAWLLYAWAITGAAISQVSAHAGIWPVRCLHPAGVAHTTAVVQCWGPTPYLRCPMLTLHARQLLHHSSVACALAAGTLGMAAPLCPERAYALPPVYSATMCWPAGFFNPDASDVNCSVGLHPLCKGFDGRRITQLLVPLCHPTAQ